jgi:hypothetical protein
MRGAATVRARTGHSTPVAGDVKEESMADEQRPPMMPSTEEPDQPRPPSDDGAEALAAEPAVEPPAESATGAPVSEPAEAQPIDADAAVQEARGIARRVLAQATGPADQATRAAGQRLTVTAAAMKERMGSAGRFSTVGRQAAAGLEQGGAYLEREGAGGVATGAAAAASRRWWLLLAVLGLVIAAIALRRRSAALGAAEGGAARS